MYVRTGVASWRGEGETNGALKGDWFEGGATAVHFLTTLLAFRRFYLGCAHLPRNEVKSTEHVRVLGWI